MNIERNCSNCTYNPCIREEFGAVCKEHKFEHEKIIEKIKEEYK